MKPLDSYYRLEGGTITKREFRSIYGERYYSFIKFKDEVEAQRAWLEFQNCYLIGVADGKREVRSQIKTALDIDL